MELLYIIYPALLKLGLLPIELIFRIFDGVSGIIPGLSSSFSFVPMFSVFFALGVVFVGYVSSHLFKARLKISDRNLRVLFLGSLFLGLLVEVVKFYRPNSFFSSQLLNGYFLVPYMSLVFLGFASIFFFILLLVLKKIRPTLARRPHANKAWLISLVVFIMGIYPFIALSIVLTEVLVDPIGNPQASRFAVVHAAIKNTCLLDPKKENCPRTLEEISYIEPQEYQEMMRGTQVSYEYFPESNDYTLIIRYSPVRAVIFDQRLVAENGLDFWEYDVSLLGKDKLKDPPEFLGPWEFEEWEY